MSSHADRLDRDRTSFSVVREGSTNRRPGGQHGVIAQTLVHDMLRIWPRSNRSAF